MRKTINLLFAAALTCSPLVSLAQQSSTWNPNLPGGKYRNPVINADYSDPDVCRAGNDYYMTSSSFACFPGLQILHSPNTVAPNSTGPSVFSRATTYGLLPSAITTVGSISIGATPTRACL